MLCDGLNGWSVICCGGVESAQTTIRLELGNSVRCSVQTQVKTQPPLKHNLTAAIGAMWVREWPGHPKSPSTKNLGVLFCNNFVQPCMSFDPSMHSCNSHNPNPDTASEWKCQPYQQKKVPTKGPNKRPQDPQSIATESTVNNYAGCKLLSLRTGAIAPKWAVPGRTEPQCNTFHQFAQVGRP